VRTEASAWLALLSGLMLAAAAPAEDLASREVDFDIPAQPLTSALLAFSAQSGLQVVTSGATLPVRDISAISGRQTIDDALNQLLSGTNLTYRTIGETTVTLVPLHSGPVGSGAAPLDPAAFRLARADEAGGQGGADGAALVSAKGAVEEAGRVELETITIEAERARSVYTGFATSATKTTTPLNETPQAISVITRDWMDMQNIQHVEDALRYAAGVKTSPYGNDPRRDTFFIRGFNQSFDGLYRDGMRTPAGSYGTWRTEPYALERVEVLRGPSSVLYGQNGPGGIVNQMSKRPSSKDVRSFTLEAGNFDTYQGAFDVGGAADDDGTLLYRLLGVYRDAGTQVDFVGNRRQFFSPAATWKPGAVTWTLMAEYQADAVGKANAYPAVGTLLPNPHGRIPTSRLVGDPSFDHFDRDQYSATSLLAWVASDSWTLRQNLRYGRLKVDYNTVNPGEGLRDDLRTYARQAVISLEDVDSITVDTNAEGRFTHGPFEHTVLFGVDLQRIAFSGREGYGPAPDLDLYAPVYHQAIARPEPGILTDQTGRQLGVYAQEHLKIRGRAVLLLGGRYDEARLESRGLRESQGAFSHREGLVWLTKGGLAPYVSHASSFAPVYGTNAYGETFDPETAQQVEAGVKYQPVGRATSVMLAVFDLRRQNQLTTDPDDVDNMVQTGEVRSRGVELEMNHSVGPWNFLASAARYGTEITKSNAGDVGFRPFGVPESFGSAWANYEIPAGPFAGLGLGGGVRYIGSSLDYTNRTEAPAVTLLDLVASYRYGKWRGALNATNLADKTYVSAVYTGDTYAYYGNRRAIMASLTYSY
jgi:iron complex outermembrane receptor protein